MKPLRIILIALFVLVATVWTAPMWGGCNLNYELCSSWCGLRHFNSSFEEVACKGSCSADKLSCMAK